MDFNILNLCVRMRNIGLDKTLEANRLIVCLFDCFCVSISVCIMTAAAVLGLKRQYRQVVICVFYRSLVCENRLD